MHANDPCHDDPGMADSCPGCRATTGVLRTTGTAPTIQTWSCTTCGLNWVISLVNPHLRPTHHADVAAAVEEIRRLRHTLQQVITLADDASTITDQQLRDRLLTLVPDAK